MKPASKPFKGIEGTRGWLALIVVVSHIVLYTPLYRMPLGRGIAAMGDYSVMVFIIISGFVITNLLIQKQETYGIYLSRRALRIYPAYLIGLMLGAAVLPILIPLARLGIIEPGQAVHLLNAQASLHRAWQVHLLLHLTLLHGIVASNLLPEATFMFVRPAWSLSLEWQFYLAAPAFVWGMRRRPILTSLLTLFLFAAFQHGKFGQYFSPSFLPGAGWYFMIGIGSRLVFEKLPNFDRYPWSMAIAAGGLLFFDRELLPIEAWVALILYMRTKSEWRILDGDLARFMGERSYAIYILHFPIMLAAVWLVFGVFGLAPYIGTGIAAALAVGATMLMGEGVYRWVERPAIRLGKTIGRESGPAIQGW